MKEYGCPVDRYDGEEGWGCKRVQKQPGTSLLTLKHGKRDNDA
jgi:hypothetical protein